MEFEDVSERVEWEAKRVAAAFGMETYEQSSQYRGQYSGFLGDVEVWWDIEWVRSDNSAAVFKVTVGGDNAPGCQVMNFGFGWEFFQDQNPTPQCRGMMAKALYCLAVQEEKVLSKLNAPLTAHERLELRHSMPREFWPQTWREEEAK